MKAKQNQIFYVYGLFDPSNDFKIFYLGKGCGLYRLTNHFCSSYLRDGTDEKVKIIRRYRNKGFEDCAEILGYYLTEAAASDAERWFISIIGRRPKGPLVNKQSGGGGMPGYIVPRTEIWCQRISEGKKKYRFTKSHREHISVAKTGIAPSLAARRKLSAALKDRPKTAAHNLAVKQAVVKFYSNREQRVFDIVSPTGHITVTNDLYAFCREHNLMFTRMLKVASSEFKQHRGYKAYLHA